MLKHAGQPSGLAKKTTSIANRSEEPSRPFPRANHQNMPPKVYRAQYKILLFPRFAARPKDKSELAPAPMSVSSHEKCCGLQNCHLVFPLARSEARVIFPPMSIKARMNAFPCYVRQPHGEAEPAAGPSTPPVTLRFFQNFRPRKRLRLRDWRTCGSGFRGSKRDPDTPESPLAMRDTTRGESGLMSRYPASGGVLGSAAGADE